MSPHLAQTTHRNTLHLLQFEQLEDRWVPAASPLSPFSAIPAPTSAASTVIIGSSAISETGVPVNQASILGFATIGDATTSNVDGLGLTLATDGTIVSIGLPIIEAGGPVNAPLNEDEITSAGGLVLSGINTGLTVFRIGIGTDTSTESGQTVTDSGDGPSDVVADPDPATNAAPSPAQTPVTTAGNGAGTGVGVTKGTGSETDGALGTKPIAGTAATAIIGPLLPPDAAAQPAPPRDSDRPPGPSPDGSVPADTPSGKAPATPPAPGATLPPGPGTGATPGAVALPAPGPKAPGAVAPPIPGMNSVPKAVTPSETKGGTTAPPAIRTGPALQDGATKGNGPAPAPAAGAGEAAGPGSAGSLG
jgi:hypothetical protein